MRWVALAATLFAVFSAELLAQEPPASVVIAQSTPKAIGEAMRDDLKDQKFKLAAARKQRIVLSQSRGNVAQATGEVLRVRLEVGFTVEELPEGHRVTVADETLIAERGAAFEQRRPQDLARNRQAYQGLLDRVKATLESSAQANSTRPPNARAP
jgi:hypothetical protein